MQEYPKISLSQAISLLKAKERNKPPTKWRLRYYLSGEKKIGESRDFEHESFYGADPIQYIDRELTYENALSNESQKKDSLHETRLISLWSIEKKDYKKINIDCILYIKNDQTGEIFEIDHEILIPSKHKYTNGR